MASPRRPAATTPTHFIPQTANFQDNIRNIQTFKGDDGTTIIIEEFLTMRGIDADPAKNWYLNQTGIHCKRVRFQISNSEIRIAAGRLQYMKGNIVLNAKKEKLTMGTKPKYVGTGEICLEPTYSYYILLQVDGEIVINRGLFVACAGSLKIDNKSMGAKASMLGGVGLLQTKLTGVGWAIISSPVPYCEIHQVQVNNEKLSVDGNNFILRKGDLKFTTEFGGTTIFQKVADTSGEGLLDVFEGTGEVWVLPTEPGYVEMMYYGNPFLRQQHQRK